MKNYVGIVKDHSASMRVHARLALLDYNSLIKDTRDAAIENEIDTVVSVIKCGVGPSARVEREIVNSSIASLKPSESYNANGNATPLWDSVGELIEILEGSPDAANREVTFICSIITDGQENNSRIWSASRLRKKITELQNTDRWSFIFRVPRGYASELSRELGVPLGNILEWEQTEKGWQSATTATTKGMRGYYGALRGGVTSTDKFFANMAQVKSGDVKREMRNISNVVTIWDVPDRSVIKNFVEAQSGQPYIKGNAYYELTKTEEVQDYKGLIVRDRRNKAVYEGHAARHLLGLPEYGTIKLVPGDYGTWDLFVQSTSLNRVLPAGTKILYKTRN